VEDEEAALAALALACLSLADVLDSDDLQVWNDAPCRTQADVLAIFDEAIARQRPAPPPMFIYAARN
jgi:hypothetical protein